MHKVSAVTAENMAAVAVEHTLSKVAVAASAGRII
jgi:nicotinamide mononucleotide (NMN) deamidase PncC